MGRGQRRTHLGIDEAGLGPTLGPICWGACQWTHPHAQDERLWQDLAPLVAKVPDKGPLRLGDSKVIHSGAQRLTKLEREVLTWIAWALGTVPKTFGALWEALVGPARERCALTQTAYPPWFEDAFALALPLCAPRSQLEARSETLAAKGEAVGLGSPCLGARVLSAAAFNHELGRIRAQGGTKNNLATEHACALARRMQKQGPVHSTIFDKMGARNAYAPFVAPLDPSASLSVLEQGRTRSSYRLSHNAASFALVHFVAKSESQYPSVALAACIAKYMREVVMFAFQAHFSRRFPEVAPTAGYPQDAKRFLASLKAHDAPELRSSARPTWIRRA